MGINGDIFNELMKYLIDHGYPKYSLAIEWPVRKYRIDLAVVDPDTKEPIAIFAVKGEKTQNTLYLGKQELRKFLKLMGNKSIPAYLVFADSGQTGFHIEKVDFNELEAQRDETFSYSIIDPFISFETLRNSRQNIIVKEKMQEQESISLWIWSLSWILAALLSILLTLDLKGRITLNTNHLPIIAGIGALILFPFIKKLKISGFEIETLIGKTKKQ